MTFAIHDKNAKPGSKKEGKKAQEAYAEGLREDWDRDMVAEERDARAARRAARGPGPTAADRERAYRAEMQSREVVRREAKRRADKGKKFVTRQSGLIVPGGYGS